MNVDVQTINRLLASSFEEEISLGLASGKMGGCIYFFRQSREPGGTEYTAVAEKLLDDVFSGIKNTKNIDVKNGLAGIGLGIHFLIKNKYVEGDINDILEDVDNAVFKSLCYPDSFLTLGNLPHIQLLLYLHARLTELKPDSEEESLFRDLTVHVVNGLYEKIDLAFFEEPLSYNFDYALPQFLSVLGKLGALDFYNCRIGKMLDEMSPKVLTSIPLLNSNRLYLSVAMQSICRSFEIKGWKEHLDLLWKKTDLDVILGQEMGPRNVFFDTGLASILWLFSRISDSPSKKKKGLKKIVQKIESSEVMGLLERPEYLNKHKGLYNGVAGLNLALMIAE